MPDAGMLVLGALGLWWLSQGQNGNGQSGNGLGSLLNADIASSGMYGGGSSQVIKAPVIGPEARRAVLSGNTAFTAMAVAADTGIPKIADNLKPPQPEIVGTLNALFQAQGPTISETSGNAVRQVGLLARNEDILNTANSPSVAFVDLTTPDGGPPLLLQEDTPIEVLPPVNRNDVLTIPGSDETTVVTTGINLWTESYFTTPGTVVKAIDQGYFDPPAAYVPQTWQQIESDWDAQHGFPDRHEVATPESVAVIPEAVIAAPAALTWLDSYERDFGF